MVRELGQGVRPHFAWGILQAAHMARTLGYKKISVIEFGVAGGNGLVAMENVAEWVEKQLGLGIEVYGFDTGRGLPKPTDYRDMPNIYTGGTYMMDVPALKKRLRRAKLKIGLISETLPQFLVEKPAPVGFVSIDVDLYTSTIDTLKLFEADPSLLLPRVHAYFDDIIAASCAEFLGERLAIAEFNQSHPQCKISPIYGLNYVVPKRYAMEPWASMIYLVHVLDHPDYCREDGTVIRKEERLQA